MKTGCPTLRCWSYVSCPRVNISQSVILCISRCYPELAQPCMPDGPGSLNRVPGPASARVKTEKSLLPGGS